MLESRIQNCQRKREAATLMAASPFFRKSDRISVIYAEPRFLSGTLPGCLSFCSQAFGHGLLPPCCLTGSPVPFAFIAFLCLLAPALFGTTLDSPLVSFAILKATSYFTGNHMNIRLVSEKSPGNPKKISRNSAFAILLFPLGQTMPAVGRGIFLL